MDRSASMQGSRIESVKNALHIMLPSLPYRQTTFNIISFGTNCNALWERSHVYNNGTLHQARNHVDTFSANYGCTELAKALDFTYATKAGVPGTAKPATEVFVLTDGQY